MDGFKADLMRFDLSVTSWEGDATVWQLQPDDNAPLKYKIYTFLYSNGTRTLLSPLHEPTATLLMQVR